MTTFLANTLEFDYEEDGSMIDVGVTLGFERLLLMPENNLMLVNTLKSDFEEDYCK